MRLLIVYGTTEGQTRKIAEYIADEARGDSHKVEIYDATQTPANVDPASFDRVVIAGSLHREQHQAAVGHFIQENLNALHKTKTAFLSVSLSAAGDAEDQYAAWECARKFVAEVNWRPDQMQIIAGALRFTKYDFFKRWILKRIAKAKGAPTNTDADHEFTNWTELGAFTKSFLEGPRPH